MAGMGIITGSGGCGLVGGRGHTWTAIVPRFSIQHLGCI